MKGGGKDRQMDRETHVSQAGPELVKDDLEFLTTFLYLHYSYGQAPPHLQRL